MSFAYPPRRLRAKSAAHYMGVSETTFLARVKGGIYPTGTKELGIVLWLRDDLDRHVERQFGLNASKGSTEHADPFAARFASAA